MDGIACYMLVILYRYHLLFLIYNYYFMHANVNLNGLTWLYINVKKSCCLRILDLVIALLVQLRVEPVVDYLG